MEICDASTQTARPEELEEASKLDILESFAMELFLTAVMPRCDPPLSNDLDKSMHNATLHSSRLGRQCALLSIENCQKDQAGLALHMQG